MTRSLRETLTPELLEVSGKPLGKWLAEELKKLPRSHTTTYHIGPNTFQMPPSKDAKSFLRDLKREADNEQRLKGGCDG